MVFSIFGKKKRGGAYVFLKWEYWRLAGIAIRETFGDPRARRSGRDRKHWGYYSRCWGKDSNIGEGVLDADVCGVGNHGWRVELWPLKWCLEVGGE